MAALVVNIRLKSLQPLHDDLVSDSLRGLPGLQTQDGATSLASLVLRLPVSWAEWVLGSVAFQQAGSHGETTQPLPMEATLINPFFISFCFIFETSLHVAKLTPNCYLAEDDFELLSDPPASVS